MGLSRRTPPAFCASITTRCLPLLMYFSLATVVPGAFAQSMAKSQNAFSSASSNGPSNSSAATAKAGLASLPWDAQGPVSAALGKEDSRYWARAAAAGFQAENPQQAMAVEFTRQGAEFRTEAHSAAPGKLRGKVEHWKLLTRAYGYGDVLCKVKAANPRADGNRVKYRRGALTEWYVNGPLGLEQGFTVAQRPGLPNGRSLTVALDATGDLVPALRADGTTVTLADKYGHAVWRYRWLRARDAAGRELRSSLDIRDRQLLLRVEDDGARYPVVIDPWVQQAELTAPDGAANDEFGTSVAVSGGTAVVGAPDHTVGPNAYQGAAYVFVQNGSTWSQQAELTASGGAADDQFGWSVAVSGGTVAVGALGRTVGSNPGQGAAYVFVQSGTSWSQRAELTASDGAESDQFGRSVAVSGSTAVVGAIAHTVGSNTWQGAAYVFVQSGASWSQQAELTASDGAESDQFGWSVAVSGGTAVVGTPIHTVGSNTEQGAAYVYVQGGSTWSQQAELIASDGAANDGFGGSVAVSGGTAVVGAFFHSAGGSQQGAAYVFVQSGSTWSQQAELAASDGAYNDSFGESVSVSGATAVVGANYHAVGANSAQGAAYIFASAAPTTTTTTVTSSANPSARGQSVTFTATVSPSGPPTPTGTVAFTFNGATITGCSAVALSSSRTATCTTSTLPVGNDDIVATYSGDSDNTGSSGTLTQVVTLPATTATVTSSLNPSTFGQSVTLTATVAPAGPPIPTGTVTFTSNGAAISGCPAETLPSSLMVTCTSSSLPVGTDTIVATYSGDSNYSGGSGTLAQLVNPIPTPVQFVPVTPCRVVDTRNANGPFGGPAIPAGTSRDFTIPSGPCAGIPSTAVAYSLNVIVVPPGPLGYVTIWPTGEGQPVVSTLNSLDGRIKADAAVVPAGTLGAVTVFANNTTNVVLDINGYFASSSGTSLQFFPLTPCRVADTRKADGPLGGPALVADTERDFPVQSSSCGIPTAAKAYSLNFTVVPPAPGDAVGYLTVWPQGETRPIVSTLNDLTGTIVANAAIVPAGTTNGEIAVYPNNATNLVIDVNGYFAAAATGGYSLYALTPCRALDTRKTTGDFTGELNVKVNTSACAPPSAAQAYVFNATVVPSGDLGYLTLWPDEETQPVVSTLNAEDGDITSNMAIVPNKDGEADAYASGTTQMVVDISAYFAP